MAEVKGKKAKVYYEQQGKRVGPKGSQRKNRKAEKGRS